MTIPPGQYRKTTKDSLGDPTEVRTDSGYDTVYVTANSTGDTTEMSYTPDQARKLARRLNKAADVAEGK